MKPDVLLFKSNQECYQYEEGKREGNLCKRGLFHGNKYRKEVIIINILFSQESCF